MKKAAKKPVHKKTVRFEPDRVFLMVVVVSVLTLAFVSALATL